MAIRVGVFGAGGRMGATVCDAVTADPGCELVAAVDPHHAGEVAAGGGGVTIVPAADAMTAAAVDVAVDFTVATAARENARSARDYLSSETWLAVNRLYHSISNTNIHLILADGLYDFCDGVRVGSHLFAGTVRATSLHDEGLQWLWTGAHLERSDMVTRLIDSKYHLLMRSIDDVGGAIDRFQWMALLRSVSGWEAYLRIHPQGVEPARVVEFLMLNPDFPRSLRTSINALQSALAEATRGAEVRLRNHPMRLIAELQGRLQFESAESLIDAGLHEYVTSVQDVLARISASLYDCFFWVDAGAA